MTVLLYEIIYVALLVFLIACVVRVIVYARAPLHLRWELYPVPHEAPARVSHGGSYFEESDWWTKPARFNFWGELKFMAPEILFLRGVWEFNRKLWYRSFPFHFGLYLLGGAAGLLVLSALAALLVPGLIAGAVGSGLHYLYTVTGLAGAALTLVGALGLLHRRLTDERLKTYTTPGDVFNLLFFIVALGTLVAACLFRGTGSPSMLALTQGLLTFDTTLQMPALLTAGLILSALLVAYIPLTHMSHFIAKYFTYHAVRWDDQPSGKNQELERKVAEYLAYRPTWAAPHVGADGTKTWAEVAAANPAQGGKK